MRVLCGFMVRVACIENVFGGVGRVGDLDDSRAFCKIPRKL